MAGIRFTSAELAQAHHFTLTLAQAFITVDQAFQKLTSAAKKINAQILMEQQVHIGASVRLVTITSFVMIIISSPT